MAAAEPVVMVVEAVEVSVTSSTDTLAVAAKAKTTTVSGAVVSDLSLQATDDNVVVRAARADMDVTGGAPLSSIIEVTTSIQTGFACRAWEYLGVSRADVEGEAVDFFAVETERTVSICVDAVAGTWNGVRFRGHVSSDGVSCTAVLEAARNGAQLLEPTLVQITADGITLTNADADAPVEVYAAPSDIRSIIDAAADLPLDGGGAFAVRAAAIRFYATGTRLPAFLLTASDVCLDGRQGTTALTCSLTRLDAYDAASHNYRCVLQKPVQHACSSPTAL